MSNDPLDIFGQIQKMVSADDEEMATYRDGMRIATTAHPDVEKAQIEHLLYAAVSCGLRRQDALQAVTVGVLGMHKGRAEMRRIVIDSVNDVPYDTLRFAGQRATAHVATASK